MASNILSASFPQWLQYFGRFIKERRSVLTAIVLGGTGTIFVTAGISKFILLRMSRKYMRDIERGVVAKQRKAAVDLLFIRRLSFLLRLIIPSWRSAEFIHLVTLTALMLTRTLLSIKIADITGKNAQYLVERRWADTIRGILLFAAIGIPASCVNSGLKYETNMLALRFRKRLTEQVHQEYLKGFNFYKASHLAHLDTADQRITADIDKFCDQLSNLYTTLFKPIMDIILVTHKLTGVVGKVGPLVLYLYYIMAAFVKRYLMPSFGQLTATESELEGKFRSVHQRLITNAEEVAFYDGSNKERNIANNIFNMLFNHSSYVRWLQGIVGVFDNFLVKYGSSIIGYVILSLPVYFPPKGVKIDAGTTAELTMEYVRSRQLLINLAGAIGQVVVLSSKVTQLAGITSRVSELFEMVHSLDTIGVKPFAIRDESEDRRVNYAPIRDETSIQWLKEWKQRGERDKENSQSNNVVATVRKNQGGQIIVGKFIRFENVNIVSPDGKLLVEDLTFEVRQHQNVMVTGPNGSGKSSLFRILGELWPLHSGTVVKPRKEDILFVPQKPYLVQGSLRDQIIYPQSVEDMKRLNITDDDITKLLLLVDPRKNIIGEYKLDDVRDWFTIFSGGQKQRIALARLFYHRPLFAILDECTSQVNEDIETKVYETCKQLGITLFTVSHRPHLKKFHDGILLFDGRAKWEWSVVDHSVDDDSSR